MVLSFFRHRPQGLEQIEIRSVAMLADARHSFNLATDALLTAATPESVAGEIRHIDRRINQAEQDLRSQLVVHATVHGTSDIASVLGFILLLKKIERIGDQAKNVLDLAEGGVSLANTHDVEQLVAEQQMISVLFTTAGELLMDPIPERAQVFISQVSELIAQFQAKIDDFMHSDRPAHEIVPRAIYYRYLKRIVANLRGVVGVAIDPLPLIDYFDGGATDTDD